MDIHSGQNIAYELYRDVQHDELEYIYRGHVSQNITESILSLAETNLEQTEDKASLKKKIYFIMVEGLQNITRHQDKDEYMTTEKTSIFVIKRKKTKYLITTGNLIERVNCPPLQAKLEKINSLEKEELNKYYKEILHSGGISDRGGAGLGLIEMSRKSGSKLYFRFKELDEKFSFFYFHTEIPSTDEIVPNSEELSYEELDKIVSAHDIINEENILLKFKGNFNEENILSLLSIISSHVHEDRIANIIIEMLQNIGKHADKIISNGTNGNLGIFYMSKKDDVFVLTSGNVLKNDKIQILKQKIDYVNGLSHDELQQSFNKANIDMESGELKKLGLGFLDMRIKSKKELYYNFHPIDNDYSFLTIKAYIK